MKGTRSHILDLLRQRGEMTVAALVEELSIVAPAVRRHLEILAGEGLVQYRTVKQQTGRPYFAYHLTEKAREADADGYARLLERILQGAATVPAGDGRDMLLSIVLDGLSHQLTDEYRAHVHGDTLEERVESLVRAMRDDGILEAWEQRGDAIHLTNSACPHRRAALVTSDLCDSERRAIAALLGEDVVQTGRMVDGRGCCEYVVRTRAPGDQLMVIS